MQEIAFLSFRKSKIFWGSMPPDLPPPQKCLGQPKILVTRLTISVTFASSERSFSKLKLLKTVMRSLIGELLTLACERDLTDAFHNTKTRHFTPRKKSSTMFDFRLHAVYKYSITDSIQFHFHFSGSSSCSQNPANLMT